MTGASRPVRAAILACVLACALALAGGARADASPAPAYRAAADRICLRANAALASLPAPSDAAGVRRWIGRAVPLHTRAVTRLRGLTPPPALRARHLRWSATLGRRSALARRLAARVARGEAPLRALESARPGLARLQATARRQARTLGLRTCAGRPSPAR